MKDSHLLGLGMRVWGPEWSSMGRNSHTQFILRLLKQHDVAEFGAHGFILGFFMEVEGTLTSKKNPTKIRNGFYPKHNQGLCSFVIREEEAKLPVLEFKMLLARRFIEASQHFAPYLKLKIPAFKETCFIDCIQSIMDQYVEADISDELADHELRMIQFIKDRTTIENR